MSRRIVIRVRCYCCDHVEYPVSVNKPTRLSPRSFENECIKCGSFNSYLVRVSRTDIRIETTWIRASKKGIRLYEERTGTKYPNTVEQV